MDTYPNPHFTNPWAPDALPVPLDELIAALRNAEHYSKEGLFKDNPHDAYLLRDGDPKDSGEQWFCAGIRYGEEGHEYLSPMPDMPKALALWNKYAPAAGKEMAENTPWFHPIGEVEIVGCLRVVKTRDGWRCTHASEPESATDYAIGAGIQETVGDYVLGYPEKCLLPYTPNDKET